MSELMSRADDALSRSKVPISEPAIREKKPMCDGPGACYWHAGDKKLAVAMCFDKMHYGPYMEIMTELAELITEDPDERVQQADLLARTIHKWKLSKSSQ